MIAVIVPFTRPKFTENVLSNYRCQEFKSKRLIVVENGAGIGTFKKLPAKQRPHILISEEVEGGKSDALNIGIHAALLAGCDYFAIFDDDDLYGPGYLDEVNRCSHLADATGISAYTYQSPEGDRWLEGNGLANIHTDGGLQGGTLAGATRGLPEFFPVKFAEEVLWCRDILRAGKTLYARASHDYVHRRFANPDHNHTFPFPVKRLG